MCMLSIIHFTPYFKNEKWCAKTEVVICNVSDNTIEVEVNENIDDNKANSDLEDKK